MKKILIEIEDDLVEKLDIYKRDSNVKKTTPAVYKIVADKLNADYPSEKNQPQPQAA